MRYQDAREFMAYPLETIESLRHAPQELITLQFDDGVLVTHLRATIFSWYLWEYHRKYPDAPLLIAHHIGNRRMNKNTHIRVMNKCFWATYVAYGSKLDIEELCKLAYEITGALFNDVEFIEEWIVSLNAMDFIEILDYPEIAELNKNTLPNEISITQTYKGITAILKDEHHLIRNRLANATKSDLVKLGQALQCVSHRGYLTDLDSHRFNDPVMGSYAEGIYTLHDSAIESRSATKSLVFNKELIKATEYFNREMQLLCQTMMGLVDGDCGTTRTLPFRVRSKDDLFHLDGKYYVTDQGLKIIRPNQTELIGEKLMLRAVRFCETPERGYVCSTCYGDLALSVPRGTNIGHVSATEICRTITQKVLSNKHLDQSSMIESIVLDNHDVQFLQVKGSSKLALSERLYGKEVNITFSRECTPFLADINSSDDIPEHSLPRYSQMDKVVFNVTNSKGEVTSGMVNVAIGSRVGYFTVSFLNHIRTHGWGMTSTGDYQVNLEGWDVKRPIFALPMKQMNMLDFKQEVEGLIKRSKKYPAGKSSPDLNDPEVMSVELRALFDLLNTRVSTNFVHVEIMLQATLIISEERRDYRIPKPGENCEYGRFTDTIKYRSLSAALAYEKQADAINNYTSYLIKERMIHPYDAVIRA